MAEPARAERSVEGRALEGRGTPPRAGNPGTYLGYVEVGGRPYAKFSAQPGTWVSSSMKSMGYDLVYPAKDAYGAYRGLVLDPKGKPLADPDRIRPGDQYLVPEQTTRGAPARAPATAPPPAAAAAATPAATPPVTKPPVSAPPTAPAVASRATAGKGLLQPPVPARDRAVEQRGGATSSRPAPRTSARGLSPEEQGIDDAIGDVLLHVLTGLALRSYDLAKPPDTPWYYSPAATLAAFGRMLDFYWSLLAYINADFGVTYGEREEARRTLKTVVFESLNTFMPLQQEAVRRARQARETARQNPDSDAADAALVEAAIAAHEALMLEKIAAIRLLLASFMAASWDDSGRLTTIPDDYKREWELVRDESRPVIDAIARQDHAVAMQAWQQFEYQFGALLPRLAEWSEQWRRYSGLTQAFAATMTVASLAEFFWTIGAPPIGPFGTPPAALAGLGGLRLTPIVEATSQLGRSALIVAMAANSGTGGGTPPKPASPSPSTPGPASTGGPQPPWTDPRLEPRLRFRWQLLFKNRPEFASGRISVTAIRRDFSREGTFTEARATDSGNWTYLFRDTETGAEAEIDGLTGEFGPHDYQGRQTLVEVKSDQSNRTRSKTDPRPPREFDVVDEFHGTRELIEEATRQRLETIDQFREESWPRQMLRQARIAADNNMLVEWRVEGAGKVRVANKIVDRYGLRGLVRVTDITKAMEP